MTDGRSETGLPKGPQKCSEVGQPVLCYDIGIYCPSKGWHIRAKIETGGGKLTLFHELSAVRPTEMRALALSKSGLGNKGHINSYHRSLTCQVPRQAGMHFPKW